MYMRDFPACMAVHQVYTVPTEARRVPWNWNYRLESLHVGAGNEIKPMKTRQRKR